MSFYLYGYAFRVVYIDVVLLAVAAEFKSMLQCLFFSSFHFIKLVLWVIL